LNPQWYQEGDVWYLGPYSPVWRQLVGAWKFGGQIDAPRKLLQQFGVPPIINADSLLVPAPQSRWRFAIRGYNQARLLAGWLSEQSGARVLELLSEPWRRSQTHLASSRLDRVERRRLSVDRRLLRRVSGRSIVLVDDVLTTGQTLLVMRRVLEKEGLMVAGAIVLSRSHLRRVLA